MPISAEEGISNAHPGAKRPSKHRRSGAGEERARTKDREPTASDVLAHTYAWFESNSGWAQPDEEDLAEWVADGVCRSPDQCLVTPTGCCPHGLASWWLILEAQRVEDARSYTAREP